MCHTNKTLIYNTNKTNAKMKTIPTVEVAILVFTISFTTQAQISGLVFLDFFSCARYPLAQPKCVMFG
jgi:hypothetical protein